MGRHQIRVNEHNHVTESESPESFDRGLVLCTFGFHEAPLPFLMIHLYSTYVYVLTTLSTGVFKWMREISVTPGRAGVITSSDQIFDRDNSSGLSRLSGWDCP